MKFSFGNTLKARLIVRFGILIVIFVACVLFTFVILNITISSNNEINTIYTPSVRKLLETKLLITKSNALISNWIFVTSDNNNPDKVKLRELVSREYPTAQKQLNLLSKDWEEADRKLLDSAKTKINLLFKDYKTVTNTLNSFESYADPMVVFDIAPLVQEQGAITIQFREIMAILDKLADSQSKNASTASNHLSDRLNTFMAFVIIIGIVVVILGIIIAAVTIRNVIVPINKVKETLKLMGKGEILSEQLETTNDEIGEMSSALNYLSDGLQRTADYAEKIGNGNLEASFISLGDKDLLGNSLLEMGKKLKTLSEEDRRRNWVTVGLAQFSDILRSSNDLKILCETILSSLIKYLGANQGGIFLVNESDNKEVYLELIACYAYDRKKFLEKIIHTGEGLVGQCLLEKDTIYLTDVPDDYVQITSGTGAATPRCIVIQPIKVNDEIVGVFEIASFTVLDKYEMEFLSKLSESVASVVSSVKVNERTVKLLEESRINQENMRSQEEELRQNLEELNATQEEMQRKEKDYINRIAILEQKL